MEPSARDHFDRISPRYRQAQATWVPLYEQAGAILAPLVRERDVLDIGNGGVFVYDPALARHVTVVDVSPEMLAGISHPNVTPVVSDARDLSAFGDASFDVAVLMLVLHHITGRSPRETNAHLDRVLGAVFRTLRAGGRLVVVEPLMRPALAPLQRLGYPLLRLVLRLFGVPMVYFQTLSAMSLRLGRHWELVAATELVLDQPVDPLGGSFPGLVRLPPWLRHADYYLLQAVKG